MSGLFSSLFNYGFRYVLKDNGDASAFSWWYEFLRVIIILFILPFDFYINLNLVTLFLMLGIGFTEFLSIYFYSRMHRESELSISAIILRLRIVWIPILAFFISGERLSGINYLGIFTIFIGLSFLSNPKKISYDKGVILSLACSVMTAVLAIFAKELSPNVSAPFVVLSMSLPSVTLFPIFVKSWKGRVRSLYIKNRVAILLVALSSVVSMYLQISALTQGTVTQVMGVFQAMSFVTVLAGIFLMNERNKIWQKLAGSVVVIIGAWLLI